MGDDYHFSGLYEEQRRRIVAGDTHGELPVSPERIISGFAQAIADFEAYRRVGAFESFGPDGLASRVFEELSKIRPTPREAVDTLHPDPVRYMNDEAYQLGLILAVIQRCFVPDADNSRYDTSEGNTPPRYHDAAIATSELFAATATSDLLTQKNHQNESDPVASAGHMHSVFWPLVTDHIDHWEERVLGRANRQEELLGRIAGERYSDVETALRAAGVVPSEYLIDLLESSPGNLIRFIDTTEATDTEGRELTPDWTRVRKAEQFVRSVDQDLETLRGEWTSLNRIRPLEIIDIAYRQTIDHPPAIETFNSIDWDAMLGPFTVSAIVDTQALSYGGSKGTTAVLRRISDADEEDCRTRYSLVKSISSGRTDETWTFTRYGLAIGYLLQELDGPVTDPVFDVEEWRTYFHQVLAMEIKPEHHILHGAIDMLDEYYPDANGQPESIV